MIRARNFLRRIYAVRVFGSHFRRAPECLRAPPSMKIYERLLFFLHGNVRIPLGRNKPSKASTDLVLVDAQVLARMWVRMSVRVQARVVKLAMLGCILASPPAPSPRIRPVLWIIVCARADEPIAVAGTTFNLKCSRCGERVMVAPSGQKRMKQSKLPVELVCLPCFQSRAEFREAAHEDFSPERIAEILSEMSWTIPNPWRNRQ